LTPETSIWTSPPASISLHEDEVHVWRLTLAGPTERFLELLDTDEVARANRFHFERDRKRFMIARGFLRLLLGRYLQTDPKHLQFVYGAWGKPSLAFESRLRFNKSQ
jgi:4'-phosphopantetheinyl transferase